MPSATQDLQQRLQGTANVLRALADSAEFKNSLLPPLLLKRLPDYSDVEVEAAKAVGDQREAAMSDRDEH